MTPFITISPSSRRLWAGDADLSKQQQHGHGKGLWGILALAWASIGVIYGMTSRLQVQLQLLRSFRGWHMLQDSQRRCFQHLHCAIARHSTQVACQRIVA